MKVYNFGLIKTSVILLIVTLGFPGSCSRDKSKNNRDFFENCLDFYRLKGNVKSLTETEFITEEKFGENQKVRIISRMINLFNENGSLDQEQRIGLDNRIINKVTCIYDKNGYVIGVIDFRDDSLKSKSVYKYDGKGNKIEKNIYNPDGSLYIKYIYKYDENGNIIEEDYYISDDYLSSKRTFEYDENGNIIVETTYTSDDSFDKRITTKYDEKGNMIERLFFNKGGDLGTNNVYKYDNKNNLIEEASFYLSIAEKSTYKYDKYDKVGNWLIKTETKFLGSASANKPPKPYVIIIEREIEYY